MADIGERVALVEQALARLTIIQEEQTKQTERIIRSMDNFTKISVTVEQNAKDIDILHEAIAKMHDNLQEVREGSTDVKEYCTTLSFSRLRMAISVSVAVVMAVFGYLYADVSKAVSKCSYLEKEVIKLEMQHREVFNGKIKR